MGISHEDIAERPCGSPKISVVIPVYKVEKYLEKCIGSVLCQTFTDYEIILVDDGSLDRCPAICDGYAGANPDRITVIHQENAGLSCARNRGLEAARGQYILFVDSDDTIQPQMLEKLYEAASTREFPDMVFCSASVIDESGRCIRTHKNDVPENIVISAYEHKELLLAHVASWCRIVRREVYVDNALRFPEGLWYEDLCMTVNQLAVCRSVVYINIPLYDYLLRKGSIMNSVNLEKMGDMLMILADIIAYYKKLGLYAHYREELEYLAVKYLVYDMSIRVLRIDPRHILLERARSFMQSNFNGYIRNRYLSGWPMTKRIFLSMINKRLYRPVAFLLSIQSFYKKLSNRRIIFIGRLSQ